MSEREQRELMASLGKSLYERGLTHGSSGNLSVKLPDGILITPTNSCLGRLDPEEISHLDSLGNLRSGRPPSKEASLHLAYYRSRGEKAIVHLHSAWSVAVSCLSHSNPDDVLPAITAYFVMKVGKVPLVPYFAPGDRELASAVERYARSSKGLLLANHGPVIGGQDLDDAVNAIEELEQTARLFLMLKDQSYRTLTEAEQAMLQ